MSNKNKNKEKVDETIKHIVTKEDVENNPGEDLKEGEEIEVQHREESKPSQDFLAEESPESVPEGAIEISGDEDNAAGESKAKVDLERSTEQPH